MNELTNGELLAKFEDASYWKSEGVASAFPTYEQLRAEVLRRMGGESK